jgi:hypothetical protein
MNNNHLLFIHIPKTAGTSLRMAALSHYGEQNTILDYGVHSAETSLCIQKHVYSNSDRYRFAQYLEECDTSFLSGHFHDMKYAPLFPARNVISFIRDPYEQVVSHYEHFVRLHGYENKFSDFVQEERFVNFQSKHLRSRPLEMFGLIGITEEYGASLDLLNWLYGLDLPVLKTNQNASKNREKYKVDPEKLELVKEHNAQDFEFYEKAKELLGLRHKLHERKLPYTHAWIQEVTSEYIQGWAFYENSDDMVSVDIYRGETVLATVSAADFRPGMLLFNPPRRGYIGFKYNFSPPFSSGCDIVCKVSTTGQVINRTK